MMSPRKNQKPIKVPTNQVAHTLVNWLLNGNPINAPHDAIAVSSDTAIATAGLYGTMTDLNIIPGEVPGDCTITVRSPGLGISDMVEVEVTAAVAGAAHQVEIDATSTTYTPKLPS